MASFGALLADAGSKVCIIVTPLEREDKVVAVLEARNGTILDVIRKIKPFPLD